MWIVYVWRGGWAGWELCYSPAVAKATKQTKPHILTEACRENLERWLSWLSSTANVLTRKGSVVRITPLRVFIIRHIYNILKTFLDFTSGQASILAACERSTALSRLTAINLWLFLRQFVIIKHMILNRKSTRMLSCTCRKLWQRAEKNFMKLWYFAILIFEKFQKSTTKIYIGFIMGPFPVSFKRLLWNGRKENSLLIQIRTRWL